MLYLKNSDLYTLYDMSYISVNFSINKGGGGTNFPFPPWLYITQFSSVTQSDSLRPHESQHTRPPCPSPTLDSILKSRDITLPIKVRLVKAIVFPVVRYGHESWTVKKAEHRRIDAFELWCWRRLLPVPWTARRSNQSILKEIIPACVLEGLMLKLKLQYCGHLVPRVDSFEETLMLGKIEGRRRRGWQRMR